MRCVIVIHGQKIGSLRRVLNETSTHHQQNVQRVTSWRSKRQDSIETRALLSHGPAARYAPRSDPAASSRLYRQTVARPFDEEAHAAPPHHVAHRPAWWPSGSAEERRVGSKRKIAATAKRTSRRRRVPSDQSAPLCSVNVASLRPPMWRQRPNTGRRPTPLMGRPQVLHTMIKT